MHGLLLLLFCLSIALYLATAELGMNAYKQTSLCKTLLCMHSACACHSVS